jgi:hypothetical protein
MIKSKPILECSRCGQRVSIADIENHMYDLTAMVCGYCYGALQNAPYEVSCFGKPTIMNGKRKLGFDPEAAECRCYCPDRVACARVLGVGI